MSENKNILITVLGSSPQVITETLFALKDKDFPQQIIIFTTEHGANQIERLSLHQKIEALCNDYNLAIPTLNHDDIHTVKDLNGNKISDIRDSEDQEAMADQITQTVRDLVADEHCVIHASIAGGRKSMSFYMGYIFSIFARPQDTLSHVLVTPEFESNNFWYPTPTSSPFVARTNPTTGEKVMLDAHNGHVELAEIPFLRINASLVRQGELLTKNASYRDTLAAYQLALTPEKIELEFTSDYRVLLNGKALDLSIEAIAFYRVIARTCLDEVIQTQYSRDKLSNLENPILAELALISGTVIEADEVPFDKVLEIPDDLQDNAGYSINKKFYTAISDNKKGFSTTLEGGLKGEIISSLQEVAVGDTVSLCEVCVVKTELNQEKQRARTKGGVLGLQLNPQQIIFS
jgi:CRISPR-associated protein (TIGR02584 family)